MTIARVKAAIKRAYLLCGPEDELWCFDALLQIIIWEKDLTGEEE